MWGLGNDEGYTVDGKYITEMQRLKKEGDDLWVLNFLHFFGGKAIFKREFFH